MSLDPDADVQRTVRRDRVVLQRVLKQLGQRDRRKEQPVRVRGLNFERQPHTAGVADVGQRPVTFERLELVGERNERAAAAFENVSIGCAQRADEPRRRVAPLIDEVRERVEVVEEKMRIDLASEAFELGLRDAPVPCARCASDRSPSREAGTRSRRRG